MRNMKLKLVFLCFTKKRNKKH